MKKILPYIWLLVFFCAQPACGDSNKDRPVHILAFGDSLTAGYNLPGDRSFAARLEKSLRDEGYQARVTNAGLSGDTTAGGLERMPWSLEDKPDIVILELGANDGLRSLDVDAMRANLEAMIKLAQDAGARVLLTGIQAPLNWGGEYRKRYEAVFPDLAEKYKLAFYPSFLDGVLLHRSLILEDGMHPNEAGVDKIVENILPLVKKEIGKLN